MDQQKNFIVIWGASGHAKVVVDIIRLQGQHRILGFLDDDLTRKGAHFQNFPILGGREQLSIIRSSGTSYIIIAVGDCYWRSQLADIALQAGFTLACALHPAAVIASSVNIQPGTVVAAGVVINANTAIGHNCIINTSASIDHDCNVGDNVHIGPGAHVAGHVNVGAGTFIGIGSIVRDHINIGANTTIGAGSLILSDVPSNVLAFGAPAVIRRNIPQQHI